MKGCEGATEDSCALWKENERERERESMQAGICGNDGACVLLATASVVDNCYHFI